jgi:hypothetical protein
MVSGSSAIGCLCPRHSHNFKVRVSDDIGFHGYWVKERYYVVEIDLLLFDVVAGKVMVWLLYGLVFESRC